jgi:basic membrane protein A
MTRKRFARLLGAAILTVVALILFVACGGDDDDEESAAPGVADTTAEETSSEPIRVAFVFDGELNDGGWNTSHDQGRQYLEENVDNVETVAVAGIPYGPKAQQTFDDLASQGFDLIVGTTDYSADVEAVAPDYPDTIFATAFGTTEGPNMSNYMIRLEDGRYVDGIVAGLATESNIIGYIGGYAIPVVVRPLDAFARGVQSVNPDAVVKAVWTNSWFDPPKERQAAEALADQGADVLAFDLNSPAVPSVAEKRDLGFVGYGYDRQDTAPNAWLSSFVFDWGPYYAQLAEQVRDGTWTPGLYYGGFEDEVLTMAPFGESVTPEAVAQAEEAQEQITNGELDVFAGPVVDNKGETVIAEGETLGEEERFVCCDWLIEGVEGSIPES